MHVIDHSTLPRLYGAGRQRFAAASRQLGAISVEVWVEMLEANARAELMPHGIERVVMVLAGHGNLHVDGAPQRFHAPCSLMLPAGAECEVINIGAESMQLVVTFLAQPAPAAVGPSPVD
ncbi:cupin domain-containing protein [Variovorax paradoxus]|nr:cupin domain-containing protein [Variovorax paradoxus]